jgi:hypothetical protein
MPEQAALWAGRMIFFTGILILVVMAVGLLVFAYRIIPKNAKPRTCPVEDLARAQQIRLPLPRGAEIVVKPDSPAFTQLIENFLSAAGNPSFNTFPEKIIIKIGNAQYALEVSIEGWNFSGEEPNCRRLRNPIQVIEIIDSLKEEYFKKKG